MKAGEVVSISGPIITGRDEMHIRALEYVHEGREVPGLIGFSFYIIAVRSWPGRRQMDRRRGRSTTSARMNKLEPEMIREFSIKAIIGKGGMSSEVLEAMKEVGCVYLAATGGAAVSLRKGYRGDGCGMGGPRYGRATLEIRGAESGPAGSCHG